MYQRATFVVTAVLILHNQSENATTKDETRLQLRKLCTSMVHTLVIPGELFHQLLAGNRSTGAGINYLYCTWHFSLYKLGGAFVISFRRTLKMAANPSPVQEAATLMVFHNPACFYSEHVHLRLFIKKETYFCCAWKVGLVKRYSVDIWIQH